MKKEIWNTSYEWKAVLLLAIGFGLVGLDRWIIAPLFPVMMKDLHLDYQDLGNVTGVLAIAWGIFSILLGGISDKVGRRKVLIPAILAFSLLAGLSGLATGLASLLLIRGLMGAFEGGFTPTSIALTQEASKPSRRGLNMGLQQSTFMLLGLGVGPILATQLLGTVPSWHWVFFIVCIPGFIVAFFLYRVIREPGHIQQNVEKREWKEIFTYRNVVLSTLGLFGVMSCLFVVAAMLPNYLTDYLKLSISEMGFITSAVGFGGFAGALILPGISDRLGRKPVLIVSLLITVILLIIFMNTGADPISLFSLLFFIACCTNGCLIMLAGPIVTESVPSALIASAAGIPIGAGEIFGGGAAPIIAGYVANHYGIGNIPYVAITGLIVCILISSFLKETAPAKIRRTEEFHQMTSIK